MFIGAFPQFGDLQRVSRIAMVVRGKVVVVRVAVVVRVVAVVVVRVVVVSVYGDE